jgi:Protein of unknown function (DUF4238)
MRNHYVPQFLQAPWADPSDSRLHVYHITPTGVRVRRKPPVSTGYETDLLALSVDSVVGMQRHMIEEEFLKGIDNDAAIVRTKLCGHGLPSLSQKQRCDWVRFIISLRLRQPEIIHELVAQSEEKFRTSLRDADAREFSLASTEDSTSLEEWSSTEFPGLIENFGLTFFHDLLDDEKAGNLILQLKWWVYDVSKSPNRLLLGDRPCVFFGGIEDANFGMVLPISPNKMFIATRGEARTKQIRSISPDKMVAWVNDATVTQAEKYVYGHDATSLRFLQNRRASVPNRR